MNLNQCNCVITGISGATGTAIRSYLLDEGATVIGTQRPKDNEPALMEVSSNDYLIEMDPLNPQSVTSSVALITERLGQIHVWINVIGGFHMGELVEESPPEIWENMYAMNFTTTLNCTQAILPHFKRFNTGRLINFGSAAVAAGMAQASPYLTSKAAVHALSKATASELEGDITCNAILPTIIDTTANRQAMPDADFSTWVTPRQLFNQIIAFIQNSENGKLVVL